MFNCLHLLISHKNYRKSKLSQFFPYVDLFSI